MGYKIISDSTILNLDTGAYIPTTPAGSPAMRRYQAWLDAGNTPEPADPPPPLPADWRGFLAALRITTVFTSLRGQARADVAANALATELRTVLGEAALGMAEPAVIQGLLDELAPSLTAGQLAELSSLFTTYRIPLTLPA